jgi:hypothetical protein
MSAQQFVEWLNDLNYNFQTAKKVFFESKYESGKQGLAFVFEEINAFKR